MSSPPRDSKGIQRHLYELLQTNTLDSDVVASNASQRISWRFHADIFTEHLDAQFPLPWNIAMMNLVWFGIMLRCKKCRAITQRAFNFRGWNCSQAGAKHVVLQGIAGCLTVIIGLASESRLIKPLHSGFITGYPTLCPMSGVSKGLIPVEVYKKCLWGKPEKLCFGCICKVENSSVFLQGLRGESSALRTLGVEGGGRLSRKTWLMDSWTFLSFSDLINEDLPPCLAERFHVISRDFMFCCLTVR